MKRQPVTSSVIASIGYEDESRVLEIEFHSGRIYDYLDVPPTVHHALLRAESIGAYFNREIRDGYAWEEVWEEGP